MTETFDEKLFPPDVAMSPTFALHRFNAILAIYGDELVQADGRFKKAREMWVTAVFLMGLGKASGEEYWLLPEHIDQTPDTYGVTILSHPTMPDAKVQEKASIEVTEWEEHADSDLATTILKKLKDKHYPDHFVLLVLARKAGVVVNFDDVAVALQRERERIHIGEIWVLGRPAESPEGGRHVLHRVFPSHAHVEFIITDEAKAKAGQMEMVKFSRGKGGEFLIDGAYHLPLPRPD